MNPITDSDGREVRRGDTIVFSYGIPPVHVEAPVVSRKRELWALTPGHNPTKCRLEDLKEFVGAFYLKP